jgi:hypothetical protein
LTDSQVPHADPARAVEQPQNVFGQAPADVAENPQLPEVPTSEDAKSRAPENYGDRDPHGDVDASDESAES